MLVGIIPIQAEDACLWKRIITLHSTTQLPPIGTVMMMTSTPLGTVKTLPPPHHQLTTRPAQVVRED